MRAFQLFRIIAYALVAWLVVSMLGRWHWLLALLVTVLAISNVAIVWMLRDARRPLAILCRRRLVRTYVGWICYLTGELLPLETEQPTNRKVLLRTKRDFADAASRAKQVVRGHDDVIDAALARIYENLTLRKSRGNSRTGSPLASFLIVGPEGVGKRYLARVISKVLYGTSAIELFDCEKLHVDTLIGSKDREGPLLESVRSHPCTLLLFEKIEHASPDVAELLTGLISSGQIKQPGSDAKTSFHDTTVLFSTTQSADSLASLVDAGLGEAVLQQRVMETLSGETAIDSCLLNVLSEVLVCQPVTDCTKAEVVALLMQKECREHGVELSNVDPEILATQVIQLEDQDGFAPAPARVKKLLRKPLIAATPERPPSLSLRIKTP